MKNDTRIVLPGEVLGTSEEFLAGEGTYEESGSIFSSILGELDLDSKEMIASVRPVNPPVSLKVNDVVLANVHDIKSSIVLVNVIRMEGNARGITGVSSGSIHVSKISEGYTSDVWKEFRIGDLVRAKVISNKPSLQLATDRSNLGVLLALCTKCRMPLIKKEGSLFCENCQRNELRNMAPDYGNYTLQIY
jgi:exosome complex component CSL4